MSVILRYNEITWKDRLWSISGGIQLLGTQSYFKDCRMGRSDKVSLWYVALLINTRFRFFILE